MKNRKSKIMIFYRGLHNCENARTLKEIHTTFIIIEECYLLELLPYFIREDIERVEVEEYDK